MQYLTIGFSTPKKFKVLSWLIRKVERTEFSHVYLAFRSESLNRKLIYQASGLQVNFVGSALFSEHHKVLVEFTIPITDQEKKQILTSCVDLAGYPYGMKQLIGLAWVRFVGLFGKKITNPVNDGRKTNICSELAGYILVKYFNYKIEDLDSLSPKDVWLLLKQHGETITTQN